MEDTGVVLARLDANVTNLITQMAEMKMAQRELVSRERLDIEIKAREADASRLLAVQSEFTLESRTHRQKLEDRIVNLEDARSRARGALWALGILSTAMAAVLSYVVGHLYIR